MITVYGVTDNKNIHKDVSKTLLGAKQYATKHGYKTVSLRHGYNIKLIEYKFNNKWNKCEHFLNMFN